MKLSDLPVDNVKIPQLNYDIIARILPGFFVLILLLFGTTVFVEHMEYFKTVEGTYQHKSEIQLLILGATKVQIGFFDTVAFLIVSYLLGWVFYRPQNLMRKGAMDEIIKVLNRTEDKGNASSKVDRKAIREMYSFIKMANYSAGQRIVKRRAEIRLWEAIRHSRWFLSITYLIIISFSYYVASVQSGYTVFSLSETEWINIVWVALKIILLITVWNLNHVDDAVIKERWKEYWNEILLNYDLIKENLKGR